LQDPPIEASDEDDPNTFNSQIVYTLLDNDEGREFFRLETDPNRDVARITVSVMGHNNLDYEGTTQYQLRVKYVCIDYFLYDSIICIGSCH